MYVEKNDGGYVFTSPTKNGAFVVKLTLSQNGEEELNTVVAAGGVKFPPRKLEPGTIQKTIGEERWKNFIRMKEQGLPSMFIDPHKRGFVPKHKSPEKK